VSDGAPIEPFVKTMHGNRFRDITGQTFNRLTVVCITEMRRRGEYAWLCNCSCGGQTTLLAYLITSGRVMSCGCLGKNNLPRKMPKHGMATTRVYKAWAGIKDRCRNPKSTAYHNYGGRGITVCERWASFEAFISDMGPRPPGASLDRIDNNGNYEPSNCRWATPEEQGNNRRNNHRIEYNGETKTISEWTRVMGISFKVLAGRLERGWPVDVALTAPPFFRPKERRKRRSE
jgi:hypothetical protein